MNIKQGLDWDDIKDRKWIYPTFKRLGKSNGAIDLEVNGIEDGYFEMTDYFSDTGLNFLNSVLEQCGYKMSEVKYSKRKIIVDNVWDGYATIYYTIISPIDQ